MVNSENILDELVRIDGFGPEITVKEYFSRILVELWDNEEGFSGKRPFGNSGWKWDLLVPIAERHDLNEDTVAALLREALATQFK